MMTTTPLADRNDETSGAGCPDAERLASYIDGGGTSEERAEIERHVTTCEDCYFVVVETVQEQRERPAIPSRYEQTVNPGQPWLTWLRWSAAGVGIAAALVLMLRVGAPLGNGQGTQPQIASGNPSPATGVPQPATPVAGSPQPVGLMAALNALDASTGDYRPLEPRLEDGFQYRPLKPVTRSAVTTDEAPLNVREAALAVESAATAPGTGVTGRRALAAMYLIIDQPANAVAILDPMAEGSRDAGLLADTAAAFLARREKGDAERALDSRNAGRGA